jgi:hypothetical protein
MAIMPGASQCGKATMCLPDRFGAATSPFGLGSAGEVFRAADRRRGLTDGTVIPHGAAPPGKAW